MNVEPMRVLIVEDEERLAENIAAALREGPGYAVDIAGDGDTGAYLAERGEYDLIVLDLMLPKVSGPDVLQRLRKKGQKAPVLVLTAITSKASIVELLNSGADDYVGKPFDLGELIARVKALVRRGKGVSHPLIRVGDLKWIRWNAACDVEAWKWNCRRRNIALSNTSAIARARLSRKNRCSSICTTSTGNATRM